MPVDPSVIASVAGGVLPTPQDYFNVGSQILTNRGNRKFAREMYERQRSDALEFWGMNNEYNSPANQMKRFQDAGLNPNLIYGQGSSGNAQAIDVPSPQYSANQAPYLESRKADVMGALIGAADLRIKNEQANNLRAHNDLIKQDILLRGLQAQRAGFDLNLEKEVYPYSVDARRESVRNIRAQTDVLLDRNVREALLNTSNLQEAAERIKTMIEQRKIMPLERGKTFAETMRIRKDTDRIVEQIDLMLKDGTIKDLDIELKRIGINPGAPVYATIAGRIFSDMISGKPGSTADMQKQGVDEVRKIIEMISKYFGDDK